MAKRDTQIVKLEKEGFYTILADKSRNRIYLDIIGTWQSPDQVPNYNLNMEKAVKELSKGFTVLVTLTEDKPPKFSITKLHKKNQKIMLEAGAGRSAVFLPGKQLLQKMTLNVVIKLTGMNVKTFNDKATAELWLDEKEEVASPSTQ